jgi:hypothetical protein
MAVHMHDADTAAGLAPDEGTDVLDLDEETVREYLVSLGHPLLPWIFDPANVIRGIDDPIDQLKALAGARHHAQVNELEAEFIDAAVRWSIRNGITKDDFEDLAVPARVLERAFGNTRPAKGTGDRAASYASYGRVAAGVCSKPAGTTMTVPSIKNELGSSGTTVRKVFRRLAEEGILTEVGLDPQYNGPGRPPTLYQRQP